MTVMSPFKTFAVRITNRTFLSVSWQHWFVVFSLIFLSQTLSGRDWIRLSSSRAEVYSNAGPKVAQQTLDRLDMLAAAFEEFGRNAARPSPLRVVVFGSESEYAAYRPSPISAGFYQSGPEGDWIVFASGAGDRVVLHEYTHLLLNRGTTRLPQWLEEGLAEFFSTVQISAKNIQFGLPIPVHLGNLHSISPMTAAELALASKKSIHYSDAVEATRFYATSWALVHMLYLEPAFARHMPEFVDAIDKAAEDPAVSFQKAFGMTLDQALQRMQVYAQRPILPSGRIDVSIAAPGVKPRDEPKPVRDLEILRVQAELLLDCGKRGEAGEKYRQIAKRGAASTEAQEALAYLALSEGDLALAMDRFQNIVERKPDASARSVFEFAMLLRESGAAANRDRVTALLERTVSINPRHPEAQFLLGVRSTDDKRYKDAVERLRQAVSILPRQFSFWHALGYAQGQLGNLADSRQSANKALRLAESPEEEKMAQDLLALGSSSSGPSKNQAATAKKPPVQTPQSWTNPAGDASIAGTLHALVCNGATEPRLQVKTGKGIEEFAILEPRKLELRNTGNAEMQLSCGALEPSRVKVEYLRANRSITAVEFLP